MPQLGAPAGLADQLDGLLAHGAVAVPGDADVAALFGQGHGDRLAHARLRPGDDGDA
ncbi:hypothetical protein [Modestobacter sp. VKM Ac-2984]|uniref:hypothetical protein n=1 Tax=Modestobacter sp. VKM Ac-2984 TaxID=3004138 RepID=UPI0022AA3225|nr:hypothetical protein [Modestobacter sp. VKM Ac-2984]MCZ2817985.1 hypothetical protein [Modestobacter sp. VKM Ac-2984]